MICWLDSKRKNKQAWTTSKASSQKKQSTNEKQIYTKEKILANHPSDKELKYI